MLSVADIQAKCAAMSSILRGILSLNKSQGWVGQNGCAILSGYCCGSLAKLEAVVQCPEQQCPVAVDFQASVTWACTKVWSQGLVGQKCCALPWTVRRRVSCADIQAKCPVSLGILSGVSWPEALCNTLGFSHLCGSLARLKALQYQVSWKKAESEGAVGQKSDAISCPVIGAMVWLK